jgi:hypothetical protein
MRRSVSAGLLGTLTAICGLLAAGPAATMAEGGTLPTITFTMTGTTIAVTGSLQSGAVDIHSITTSAEAEPTLVKLNPGVTIDQVKTFLTSKAAADPNNVPAAVGSIVFDADAPKGTSDAQTTLAAGDYAALDAESSNPAKFPITAITIAPAAAPAVLPTPAATVKAIEFAFTGPSTLHVGELVRFENDGFLTHMIVAIEAKNAASARKIISLLRAGKSQQADHYAIGGVSFLDPVSPGYGQQLQVSAKPGVYVLACFMETQDHRDHTQLGMVRLIHIVK